MALAKTLLSLLALATVALASPTAIVPRQQDAPSTGSVRRPAMHNIFPQQPDAHRGPLTGLHLETFANLSQLEQVAVFRGIPAAASNCVLQWDQADKDSRTFIVKGGSGLTRMRLLEGLPDGPITFDSIRPFDTAADEDQFGADFTLWDDEMYGAQTHIASSIPCAEDIFIKISMRDPTTKTSLYLGQDDNNGLWIEYDL
ncbi:hypothetical protein B0I35DRAFT_434041 [Stachybotrys elegans]|uniref:Ubiquitin 3 binding protein But2 C-terminal domain-containing protein n=1 Tax=Stachybotrys elegans TaxID=80388 RepID=A0A8K0SQ66_9HYPO|nr:hypothetical protein B0I35DRAFT_434041 [Stachybotrys elegans]